MARPEPTTIPLLNRLVHGPVQLLEATLLAQQTTIEYWFRRQWQHTRPPLYASVDLRNAGFKLAPVDTNLFPAGFNNLSADCQPLCVQAMRQAIERSCPTASRVLIVPESHTRNPYYLDSLGTLAGIVAQAGFEVRIGSLRPDLTEPAPLESRTVRHLQLEPLVRHGARIGVADFDPCLVLLNNDLSGGLPAILQNIEQTVLPPPGLGWTHRSKSHHFDLYAEVTEEFAELLGLDPWLITPESRYCGQVDFQKREGMECLEANGRALLTQIEARYAERDIAHPPFLIVKADAGTYGMGIMSVRSVEEITQIKDPKQRERRVIELHISQQVRNLLKTSIVQRTLKNFGRPKVHGWVYDLETGLINDLHVELNPKEDLLPIFQFDFPDQQEH